MSTFEEFKCPLCAGTVRMLPPNGKTRVFRRGVAMRIPDDIPIPTCASCDETFMGPEDSKRVDAALDQEFRREQKVRYRAYIDVLQHRHAATIHEIEDVCAVTHSYLSHVLHGRRRASTMLTRFLEAMIACPSEFERHRGRTTFQFGHLLRAQVSAPQRCADAWSRARERWGAPPMLLAGARVQTNAEVA